MRSVFGKENALLRRRETAADDEDRLAGEELAVAGRAVGNAVPAEIQLALESDRARMRAGGDEQAETFEDAAAGHDPAHVAVDLDGRHFGEQELRAEVLRLAAHALRQFRAAGALDARIIDDFGCDRDLSAELFLLHDQDAVTGPRQIKSGGQSSRTAADNDRVVEIFAAHAH